jgi:predicted transcriptional regulator
MAQTFEDVLRSDDVAAGMAPELEPQNAKPEFRSKVRQKFGPLWLASNESILFSLILFRSFDDDDLAAISLALHQITIERSTLIHSLAGRLSCHQLLTQPLVSGVSVSVAELCQATGIPRETVRRKLAETDTVPHIEGVNGQGYQLTRFRDGLFSLLGPALCLGSSLDSSRLSLFPRSIFVLPARPFLRLVSAYLKFLLCGIKLRRADSRTSISVSIKTAFAILTGLKVSRLAMIDCTVRGDSAASFLAALPQAMAAPYYLAQVASVANLPIAKVRRLCRSLEQDGILEFVKDDVVRNVSMTAKHLLNRNAEEIDPVIDSLKEFESIYIDHRDELCKSEVSAADAPILTRRAFIE